MCHDCVRTRQLPCAPPPLGHCVCWVRVEGCAHRIDGDLHFVHLCVAHFVVGSVDQDLIEDLVQPRDILNVLEHQLLPIVHPQLLLLLLSAAYRWHRDCFERPECT